MAPEVLTGIRPDTPDTKPGPEVAPAPDEPVVVQENEPDDENVEDGGES